MKNWYRKRKERKAREEFLQGYDWAAGMLLRREAPACVVEPYLGEDNFDYGARQAIIDWNRSTE